MLLLEEVLANYLEEKIVAEPLCHPQVHRLVGNHLLRRQSAGIPVHLIQLKTQGQVYLRLQ
jgi:hypothetical protein